MNSSKILSNALILSIAVVIAKIIDFLYLAIVLGTLSGLVCKYILDKKYIFYELNISVFEEVLIWIKGLGGNLNEKN